MLIKMIKTTLSLILALCLGASLCASPAWAAGGQKQQCQNAIKDCIEKAKRQTCNRSCRIFQRSYGDYYPNENGLIIYYQNNYLCFPAKWWVPDTEALARGCPSGKQVVSFGAVDSALERARRDMVHKCFQTHVFIRPDEPASHPINQYPGRDQNGANCNAFVDTFTRCLRAKAKLGLQPHK